MESNSQINNLSHIEELFGAAFRLASEYMTERHALEAARWMVDSYLDYREEILFPKFPLPAEDK